MEQHEIALKVILVLITLSICYVTLSNHLGSDSLLTQLVQGVLLVAFVYVTGTIWAVSTTDAPNGIEW